MSMHGNVYDEGSCQHDKLLNHMQIRDNTTVLSPMELFGFASMLHGCNSAEGPPKFRSPCRLYLLGNKRKLGPIDGSEIGSPQDLNHLGTVLP
jgi:hypothetical protein